MKKTLHLLLVLLPVIAIGQTQTENYIKTTTYKEPTATSITNPTALQASQSVTYFDGLGRPVQQVAHQQSGTGKDIVTPIEYDAFGRQVKDYLPYVPTAAASLDYKTSALTEVGTFYNKAAYENTLNPFSQKEFEASPLSRVLKQAAPGNDWKLGNDHEIRFDYQTNTNADQVRRFGVSFIGGNTENPYLEDQGIYEPSQLYKTITKDENWQSDQVFTNDHSSEEFKDKDGRVVLKRTFDVGKWHDTYYVYDDYGNLTYVLPPKVLTYSSIGQNYLGLEKYLESSQDFTFFTNKSGDSVIYISQSGTDSLGFSFQAYNFTPGSTFNSGKIVDLGLTLNLPNMNLGDIMVVDVNGNSIVGATAYIQDGALYFSSTGAAVYISSIGNYSYSITINLSSHQVNYIPPALDRSSLDDLIYQYKYDKRNRLIEKKLPGKEWEYIVYDKLDRPVLTQDANLRLNNKWLFTKYDVFGRVIYTGIYTNGTYLNRIDMQNYLDIQNNTSNKMYETKAASGTGYLNSYYTNDNFPNSAIELYTINYYDNYSFDKDSLILPQTAGGVSIINYDNATNTQKLTKSLPTGTKVRVLGSTNWITTVTGYDTKGRAVYTTKKNNFLSTTDMVENTLDFVGKIEKTITTHTKGTVNIIIEDLFTYDTAGRLKKQTQELNNSNLIELISENFYDELGQLSSKKVGGKTLQGLQKVDYTYNIRGWLKGMNDPNNLNLDNDLFGFGLNYNTIKDSSLPQYNQNIPLYNGNISNTFWQINKGTPILKQYNYSYDALNRFKHARYAENNIFNSKFDESTYEYDRNGNMMNIYRSMQDPNDTDNRTSIDYLEYTYNGNQLMKVDDTLKDFPYGFEGFKDGNNTGDDYSYDGNGNMILDHNKGITAISYNHLNLPVKITFGSGTIEYAYDATGVKQSKIVNPGVRTDYANGFQYEDGILKFFPYPEGYVEYNAGNFNYIYQYKDHLGNVRLTYKDVSLTTTPSLQIVEENNYYPFGLKHKDNNVVNSSHPALKFKYNGKELQDELGLNMYDYGARNYDPALGRWMNIDPLAENSRRWTPYNYAYNNPIYFIDPDGMQAYPPTEEFLGNLGIQVSEIQNGYEWTDNDGSWKYNSENKTWEGQNGTDVNIPAETVHLNEVVASNSGKGSSYGVGAGVAVGGGFGIEAGLVQDSQKNWGAYFSFKANYGFGEDVGVSMTEITPQHDGMFLLGDFEGSSLETSIGVNSPLGGGGVSFGGTNAQPEYDLIDTFRNIGRDARGYTTGTISPGLDYPSAKLNVGGMVSSTTTWVWDF